MFSVRIIVLTSLAMIAFAGNSLLCRFALKYTRIDPASFTSIRLISGAIVLGLLVYFRHGARPGQGSWLSAFLLFVYAAGFSFAYVKLPAAMGALLLFGAVQATMIGYGLYAGERFLKVQVFGFVLALTGLFILLLPGLSAPPLASSSLMLLAGAAWGFYSLRGKIAGDPVRVSAGNFIRAIPFGIVLSFFTLNNASFDAVGFYYAVLSGALASGIGYAIWYGVLPELKASKAATIQLSVPVISSLGGVMFLSEPLSLRLLLASTAILGGIALFIMTKLPAKVTP
jgi:drug/metabolite transporter (DMT)-like permease